MGGFHAFEPSGCGRDVADRRQSSLISGNFLATEALAARKRSSSKSPKKPAAAGNKPADLKPGQFEWHPDRSPSGPLAIIVSLTKQRVYVYRNGIQIGVSTCSTGKKDHETPTGVFTILEKEKEHYSSTYDDAAMPMMQRLTWDGIALHAGKLPGYPASHGCVRLPKAFAEKLYAVTQTGTPVIIADAATAAVIGLRSRPAAWRRGQGRARQGVEEEKEARLLQIERRHLDPRVERRQIHLCDPERRHRRAKARPRSPIPARSSARTCSSWRRATRTASPGRRPATAAARTAAKPSASVVERIKPPADVQAAIDERMKPGMVFITTDQPATPETRSGKDFTVMDSEGK